MSHPASADAAARVQLVIDALARAVNRAVLLDDASLTPISYSRQLGVLDDVRTYSVLQRGTPAEIRAELAAIEPRKPCCRLAELSALARLAGTLHLRGGGSVALHLDLGSHAVARRAFVLLRGFGLAAEIRAYRRQAFGKEARFQLHLGDATLCFGSWDWRTRLPRTSCSRSCRSGKFSLKSRLMQP